MASIHAVISCYNFDPGPLIQYFDTFTVYDQSTDGSYSKLIGNKYKPVAKTPNSGHSLSHYFDWILNNYESLPDYVFFLKSNILDRHIDERTFKKLLSTFRVDGGYVGFFNDPDFKDKQRIAYYLFPGLFIERNNSWYIKKSNPKYFISFNSFLKFIYRNPILPEYVPFTPGACFGVSRGQIQKIPKEVWATLLKISTYKFFPPEAYLVERILYTLFHAPFTFNSHFNSFKEVDEALSKTAEKLSRHLVVTSWWRERFLVRFRFIYKLYFKIVSKMRFEITKRY